MTAERLLEAAEEVFAAKGTGASTEEIARQAGVGVGVGVGTVFRHFPTKEALLSAVFLGRLSRLGEQARALAGAGEPGPAFFEFFTLVVDQAPAKSSVAEALEQLLGRAQAAGAVPGDIGVAGLKALLVGASRAVEYAEERQTRSRTLAVFLDGLRMRGSQGVPAART